MAGESDRANFLLAALLVASILLNCIAVAGIVGLAVYVRGEMARAEEQIRRLEAENRSLRDMMTAYHSKRPEKETEQ